ncbi:TetR family transcriptional regulator [Cellulomonas sp. DKR-3]|uniref:TetR family transcriptional regulator n=1 Tax=Cellulomonas fulva TaxID=2835530 RepID=A0ABS5TW91_9CELL|nr:TetR family transcriptional regulator [Cellulomonas fulva]MBT0993395.1 TetR family transcriptional regulator [Cellulomonas fulva]
MTEETGTPDEDGRREAQTLRRDRERDERAVAKELERARRDEEKAADQRRKDEDRARRDAERREQTEVRTREQAERDAQRAAEQARRERERAAQDAAKEAGRALREAAKAERAAALAQLRATREAARARREAERADEGTDGGADGDRAARSSDRLRDLPPDIAVLWREPAPPRRGPRPGLSLDQIADAAIALADTEGLDAVSMARVAESLGFTTMSLYRYVTSKDELLMLMSDRVADRPPRVGREVGDWRARLELLLELTQPILAAHPWMSRTTTLLFAVGPNRLAWMEAMVAALEDTPLDEATKLQAVGALSGHQLEWARLMDAEGTRQRAVAAAQGRDGSDEDWHDSVIARLVDPAEHPAMARAVAGGALDPANQPVAGLDLGTRLILDGLATLIART